MTTEAKSIILEHPKLGRVEFEFWSPGFWSANLTAPFGSSGVSTSISFWERDPTLEALDPIARKISELSTLDVESRRALLSEAGASKFVQSFKKKLFEDLDPETLIRHFGAEQRGKIDDVRFVESLQLVKVDIADDPEAPTVSCCYSIDQELPTALDVMFWTSEGCHELTFSIGTWGAATTTKTTPVTLEHRLFGKLEFDADGFASTELRLGETPVPIDITFERQPTKKRLDTGARLLADLPVLDERARAAMAERLASDEEDDAVPLYKSHHAEELDDAALLDDATFLARLQLVRLRVDVEKRGGTVDCDYSLGEEATQYVLTVRFTLGGRLREIAFES